MSVCAQVAGGHMIAGASSQKSIYRSFDEFNGVNQYDGMQGVEFSLASRGRALGVGLVQVSSILGMQLSLTFFFRPVRTSSNSAPLKIIVTRVPASLCMSARMVRFVLKRRRVCHSDRSPQIRKRVRLQGTPDS